MGPLLILDKNPLKRRFIAALTVNVVTPYKALGGGWGSRNLRQPASQEASKSDKEKQ
jgi:hypothetical protein